MLSIIVATDQNNLIGKDNDMPWHIPADLKRFKAITTGHTIVMGRKTYDSLPKKPLPNRHHVVLTCQEGLHLEGCEILHSIQEVVARYGNPNSEEVFIIGGGNIYKSLLPYAQKIYLTKVHIAFEGDTFFPSLDMQKEWRCIENTDFNISKDNPYPNSFSILERIGH